MARRADRRTKATTPPIKLNGEPVSKSCGPPPQVKKFQLILDGLPKDEVFTNDKLFVHGITKDCMTRAMRWLTEYHRLWRWRRIWGSRQAIKSFDAWLESQ